MLGCCTHAPIQHLFSKSHIHSPKLPCLEVHCTPSVRKTQVSAPGEEPAPSPGVHTYTCVLSHMHGVPGMPLGAGTPNHEGMQHMNIPAQSFCQHLFKHTHTPPRQPLDL